MTRIHDVLKYSTIMNIFFLTPADWFMMTRFMNLANRTRPGNCSCKYAFIKKTDENRKIYVSS